MADAPEDNKGISDADRKKAKVFFDRARTVADTGNYDYAIEMFLQGLALDPESKEAHQALRDVSLKRKALGGKDLGMLEKMKLKRPSKDDRQNLLNAERLMAYDPGNTDNMVAMLQNANKAGFVQTVLWLGPIILRANSDSPSPDFHKYIILKDVYRERGEWKLAQECAGLALRLRPDEMDLHSEMKNLAAHDTMREGNYDGGDGFRGSMRDKDSQDRLRAEDRDIKSVDLVTRQIMEAEAAYKADPVDGRLMRVVELLEKTEDLENENRALELLDKIFKETKNFRFRQRIGKINMSQLKRQERMLKQMCAADPNDAVAKADYDGFRKDQLQFELKEYRLWSENYPTDLPLKYETSVRMIALGMYDEAIPLLQQARNDPKLKVDASVYLGRAFLDAGFVDEAIETLQVVNEDYVIKGDDKSKLINYWLGRALEQGNNIEAALKRYSQVFQWEATYKDVQQRIKTLRAAGKQT